MVLSGRLLLITLLFLVSACAKGPVQKTGYAGDGEYEGQPPMCFQISKESRPSASSQNHHSVAFNNTCNYWVACDVTNTLNDNEQSVNVPSNQNRNLLIAINSDERSFDIDVNCHWTP